MDQITTKVRFTDESDSDTLSTPKANTLAVSSDTPIQDTRTSAQTQPTGLPSKPSGPASAKSNSPTSSSSSQTLSTGIVIGIVAIALAVIFGVLGAMAFFCYRRRASKDLACANPSDSSLSITHADHEASRGIHEKDVEIVIQELLTRANTHELGRKTPSARYELHGTWI